MSHFENPSEEQPSEIQDYQAAFSVLWSKHQQQIIELRELRLIAARVHELETGIQLHLETERQLANENSKLQTRFTQLVADLQFSLSEDAKNHRLVVEHCADLQAENDTLRTSMGLQTRQDQLSSMLRDPTFVADPAGSLTITPELEALHVTDDSEHRVGRSYTGKRGVPLSKLGVSVVSSSISGSNAFGGAAATDGPAQRANHPPTPEVILQASEGTDADDQDGFGADAPVVIRGGRGERDERDTRVGLV